MANINPLDQQLKETNHLLKQVGSLKTLVRDALSSLEDARLNMPMTIDRDGVDQKLEQFYERLHKITQQDTDFLEEKWQNQ